MVVNIKQFSIQENLSSKLFSKKVSSNNNSCEVFFNIDKNKGITKYLTDWSDQRLNNDVVLKLDEKYYLVEKATISILNLDNFGEVMSCKMKYSSLKDVSRDYKINMLLN